MFRFLKKLPKIFSTVKKAAADGVITPDEVTEIMTKLVGSMPASLLGVGSANEDAEEKWQAAAEQAFEYIFSKSQDRHDTYENLVRNVSLFEASSAEYNLFMSILVPFAHDRPKKLPILTLPTEPQTRDFPKDLTHQTLRLKDNHPAQHDLDRIKKDLGVKRRKPDVLVIKDSFYDAHNPQAHPHIVQPKRILTVQGPNQEILILGIDWFLIPD